MFINDHPIPLHARHPTQVLQALNCSSFLEVWLAQTVPGEIPYTTQYTKKIVTLIYGTIHLFSCCCFLCHRRRKKASTVVYTMVRRRQNTFQMSFIHSLPIHVFCSSCYHVFFFGCVLCAPIQSYQGGGAAAASAGSGGNGSGGYEALAQQAMVRFLSFLKGQQTK